MPRRKRRDLQAARAEAQASKPDVDTDVAMFARRTREADAARRQAKRDARTAKQRAEEGERLHRAKDDAASALRAVRRQERIRPGQVEAAETAYRSALAALMTFGGLNRSSQ